MEQAGLASLLPILILFILFYFLLIKPQQKKAQQQKKMIEELKVGDTIVLTSGIICDIESIPSDKDYLFVYFNRDNIVRIFKDAIMDKYNESNSIDKNKK